MICLEKMSMALPTPYYNDFQIRENIKRDMQDSF